MNFDEEQIRLLKPFADKSAVVYFPFFANTFPLGFYYHKLLSQRYKTEEKIKTFIRFHDWSKPIPEELSSVLSIQPTSEISQPHLFYATKQTIDEKIHEIIKGNPDLIFKSIFFTEYIPRIFFFHTWRHTELISLLGDSIDKSNQVLTKEHLDELAQRYSTVEIFTDIPEQANIILDLLNQAEPRFTNINIIDTWKEVFSFPDPSEKILRIYFYGAPVSVALEKRVHEFKGILLPEDSGDKTLLETHLCLIAPKRSFPDRGKSSLKALLNNLKSFHENFLSVAQTEPNKLRDIWWAYNRYAILRQHNSVFESPESYADCISKHHKGEWKSTNPAVGSVVLSEHTVEHFNDYKHVHFGAGNLGIGLVVPALSGIRRLVVFQRVSDEWNRLKANKEIRVSNKNRLSRSLRLIYDNGDISPDEINEYVREWLEDSVPFFIYSPTSDWGKYKAFIENADTLSCSLRGGQSDLIKLLSKIELKKELPLFPFENRVNIGFRSLTGINTIKVVADRICHSRAVFKDRVEVNAESWGDIVVNCSREEFPQLFSTHDNIGIHFEDNAEVFDYYYRRKRYLINGLHFALSICCYHALKELKIPSKRWGEQYLSIVLGEVLQKNGRYLPHIRNYVDGQIMRLVLECSSAINKKYIDATQEDIFDDLRHYSDEMLLRTKTQPDNLKRILDFKDPDQTIKNSESHLNATQDYIVRNLFKIDGLPIRRKSYADDVLKSLRSLEHFLMGVSVELASKR